MESSPNSTVLRRIGVIGDIHCEDEALDLVLRHFSSLGIDNLLAVGDLADGAGDINRACSLLRQHGVLSVAGNHDRWLLAGSLRELPGATSPNALHEETRVWLAQLPKTRSFQTPRGPLLLCHGIGEDDMACLRPDTEPYAIETNFALKELMERNSYGFVIGGHTHHPMLRIINQVVFINAGSLDRRERQVCSIVNFDERQVEFFNVSKNLVVRAELFTFK